MFMIDEEETIHLDINVEEQTAAKNNIIKMTSETTKSEAEISETVKLELVKPEPATSQPVTTKPVKPLRVNCSRIRRQTE